MTPQQSDILTITLGTALGMSASLDEVRAVAPVAMDGFRGLGQCQLADIQHLRPELVVAKI